MRKIILLFILLVPIIKVKAITYYSDYYDYEMNTTEYLLESDLIKREEYKLYNTFEVKRKDIGYSESCSLFDKEDYIDEETYSTTKFKATDKLYQAFEFNNAKIHAMRFKRIQNTRITIYEIIIKNKGKLVDFEFSTELENIHYLNDGNPETGLTFIKNDTLSWTLDYIPVDDLTIEFVTDTLLDTSASMNIEFDDGVGRFFNMFNIKSEIIEFKNTEEATKLKNIVGDFDNEKTIKTYYKKVDRLYLCYTNEKVILNKYVLDGDNIIEDDYKLFYNYYKRDYLTLKDEKLNSKKKTKDLIESTSFNLEDLRIEDNIDYEKSGKYQVDYIFNDYRFSHEVEYETLNDISITTLTTTPIKKNTTNSTKSITITKRPLTKNTITTKIENLLLATNSTSSTSITTTIKRNNEILEEDTDLKNKSNKVIIIIIITSILLIILTLFLTQKIS